MRWTPKQKEVIDARGSNLLVSAAAGSGKTAVLVERIIRLICDEEHPVDIDRLLVMTFTNAAAAEMRERIAQAIERKLEEEPEREHLQVQAALVHRAQITTIDSFCLSLIRDHFNMLDLDPGFRIGDEGELMLLRADVMEQMLEEYYESEDREFQEFVETYGTGKSDSGIEDYIMQVYTFSQSNPFPWEWLAGCRQELESMEEGCLKDAAWLDYLMRDVKGQLEELEEQLEGAIEVCGQEGGPEKYIPTLHEELEMIRRLRAAKDYEALNRGLGKVSFGRIAAARGKDIDPAKKEYASSVRERVKKALGTMKTLYGQQTMEEAAANLLGGRGAALKLLELAGEFDRRYQESKKEKNIVDFNDLEHEALRVLVVNEDGKLAFTPVADELSRKYAEILVDEYQDSNDVQETLLKSLSAERFGRPNVFMVGDVKQSIYKFRLARPELFMKKYESYEDCQDGGMPETRTEGGRKIELRQNFRSRASVLDSVNQIFFQIMTKNLGNIQYTDSIALHPGAVFEETEEQAGTPTELLMADTGTKAAGPPDKELEEYTSQEIEARLIAGRIRQLTDPEHGLAVWDKAQGCYRRAKYGDMVILLRSLTGWTDSFLNVLTQEDIPAFAETGTGYFDTIEVETVLAMLAVIDNPIQDIPLAAVLKSPVVGMSEEELAWLAAVEKKNPKRGQDRGIYGAVKLALDCRQDGGPGDMGEPAKTEEEREGTGTGTGAKAEGAGAEAESWRGMAARLGAPEELAESVSRKIQGFYALLEELRKEAAYIPIHELIHRMYLKTGYYDYVSAMPAGEVRKANLDMLIEKAWAYEKTSYKGLFHFIRYIGKLKKYDTDFGEATAAGKSQDMVRLMSIHKSKGLEFPVVFLAGAGKKFNKQDIRGKLLIDSDLGIGTDYLNVETRVKTSTLKKNVLKRKMDMDNLGEELRVLYVAMTRAKEKLIITGTDRSLEKKLEKWQQKTWDSRQIPHTILMTADSYLDWILMTGPTRPLFQVEEVKVEALVGDAVERKIQKIVSEEELTGLDLSQTYDRGTEELLRKRLSYEYPHRADIDLYTKMSVSQLKKQSQDIDDRDSLYQPVIPDFLKPGPEEGTGKETEGGRREGEEGRQAGPGGAVRGSAYHRVLEMMDFAVIEKEADVRRWLSEVVSRGVLPQETRALVQAEKIWTFFCTPLGKRMREAGKEGRLHREDQFVMGIPAEEAGLGDSKELVLIQGIIDAWMDDGDGLVLIDYKTDRVGEGQEEVLVKRYETQFRYYRRALEQMKKKPVKECFLYSLSLQKAVSVDMGRLEFRDAAV